MYHKNGILRRDFIKAAGVRAAAAGAVGVTGLLGNCTRDSVTPSGQQTAANGDSPVITTTFEAPPDAGYYMWDPGEEGVRQKLARLISNQVVWIYSARSTTAFFSQVVSGCQRLANGNTLICEGIEGHIFEVTNEGELVWDYINPVAGDHSIMPFIPDLSPGKNAIFRVYRYGPDYPGLQGRDLMPGGSISSSWALDNS
ncbi:MAG: twin-arginine translocation signal domain-containing protein [Dehalococcoidales bacterium]|nr:twin-arginine translocation signal domain-containing protein [Dehalococcoidales bacterium]